MTMCSRVFWCLCFIVTVFSLASSNNVTNLSDDGQHSSTLPTTQPEPAGFTAVYSSGALTGSRRPIPVQKCCPAGQVLRLGQYSSECTASPATLLLDVFWANATHYWNHTNTARADVMLVPRIPCNESKYFLNPLEDSNDTFHVLHNQSLYVPHSLEMLGPERYCVEVLQDASGASAVSVAVVCTATPADSALHFIFGIGLLLSVVSLCLLAAYTLWRDDWLRDHKRCLAFFSGTMALSLFLVAVSVFFGRYMPNLLNILIAYIVYYLKLNYFLWLTMLCYDTRVCTKSESDADLNNRNSFKWYMLAAYLIPLLFILINLIDRCNPALPNLYMEFSYSTSFLWGLLLFYVPNIVTVVVDIYIMYSISLPKDKYKTKEQLWEYLKTWKLAPESKTQMRNMFRRTCLLCILLLAFLLLDLVIYLLPSQGEQQPHFILRDVVYCMQGVFIACMFLRKDCCRRAPADAGSNGVELEKLNRTDVA